MSERDGRAVKHETYYECPLPKTAQQGEKISCECGRIWRFDNGAFIVEGHSDAA